MVDSVSIRPAASPPVRANIGTNPTAASQKLNVPDPLKNAHPQAGLPKLMQMAAALAEQGAPIDFAKIAKVRHAIANGDYNIDANRIAAAMVHLHKLHGG